MNEINTSHTTTTTITTSADALWGAAYLADLGPEGVDSVVEAGLVREMVQRLYSDEERVVAAALRATGSIAAGTNEQVMLVGGREKGNEKDR